MLFKVIGKFKTFLLNKVDKVNKGDHEMDYWNSRKEVEGVLSNAHYENFYTTHFGLDRQFYKSKKILDIGCGPRGSLEWADTALERIGLDPLADKYKEIGADKHKMKYVSSGSENIPFEDGHFDVVCSFNSLDHVDDLEKTISEIKRVVKKGGLFLFLCDVNHEPTKCEPIVFGFDIVDMFKDVFEVVEEIHYEKSENGMYQSIDKNIIYNHKNRKKRYGVISCKFKKNNCAGIGVET